jgi:hypothetical protein
MTSRQVPAGDSSGPHADPGTGHGKTTAELFTDCYFQQTAHVHGASHEGPGADWRLIRAAQASAREIGLRASIPDPAAARTPEYAADLAQWGGGRGIGPAGPGTGAGPEAGE